MQVTDAAPEGFEDCPIVEPLAWRPAFQAWQERADTTRELAALVADRRAKNLLLLIADTYERFARE